MRLDRRLLVLDLGGSGGDLGLAAVIAFLGMNDRRLTMTNDEAYELVMSIASGSVDDIALIAQRLDAGSGAL